MAEEKFKREICDGVIVAAGYSGSDNVVFHTASQKDAQWLYSAVKPIAETRNIDETGEMGLHRNYYLELAESDDHSLDDGEDEFEWNTRPVHRVTFIPTKFCHKRMLDWVDNNMLKKAPTDFTMTPAIAEMIYRAGAFLMYSGDGIYMEFDAENSQKLDAEFQNQNIHTTNVGELYRCDVENTEKFAEYAGIDLPHGGD